MTSNEQPWRTRKYSQVLEFHGVGQGAILLLEGESHVAITTPVVEYDEVTETFTTRNTIYVPA